MIDYIIVDDEPIAHRIIEGYCKNLLHLNKRQNCFNAFEAIDFLNKESVDLIFLDINMPKLMGFDFLKSLSNTPKVIVTTAYKEFALEGYELNVSDYLLKPFSFNRFLTAVNKTIDSNKKETSNSIAKTNIKTATLFVKGDKKHHQIKFKNILFIEAYGNYTKLHLFDKTIITHKKISNYEEHLSPTDFLRIHKSFIVATNKINVIEGNKVIIGNQNIPIGQTYKTKVIELLEKYKR